MEQAPSALDRSVATGPFPVAAALKQYRDIRPDRWSDRTGALVSVAETIVKLLAAIAAKSLLTDGAPSEEFRRELAAFGQSSLGHWVALLRTALRSYEKLPRTDLIEALVRWYQERVGGDDVVRGAVEELCRIADLSPSQGKLTNAAILDLLALYRNTSAHGSRLSDEEYRERLAPLQTLVGHLVAGLSFLEGFPLCFVEEVALSEGAYVVAARVSVGREFVQRSFRSPAAILDGRLYAMRFDGDGAPAFALDLSPYVLFRHCPTCKGAQVFFYNAVKGRSLQYLSYGCGHHLRLEDPTGDFAGIEEYLAGKIPLDTLLKGKVIGRSVGAVHVGASREGRAKAERLSALGQEMLERGLPTEALRHLAEADRLDPDSAENKLRLALAMLASRQSPADVLATARQAARLAPDSARFPFALAQLLLLFGMPRASSEELRKAVSLDPADQGYREALAALPDVIVDAVEAPPESLEGERADERDQLVRRLLEAGNERMPELALWITAMPPWRWIAPRPLVGAAALMTAVLAVVLGTSWRILSPINVVRLGVIALLCTWGLAAPFVGAKALSAAFARMRGAVTLPTETFSRWFLAEMVRLGAYRPGGDDPADLRGTLRGDRFIFASFWLWTIGSVPFVYACVRGLDAPGGELWARGGTVAGVIRYAFYLFEIFTLVWVPAFVVRAIELAPSFASLPVRYFVGMPDAVSLKPLGTLYLRLAAIGAPGFALFALQHYVGKTYETAPVLSTLFVVVDSAVFFAMLFVSQAVIAISMSRLKQRFLVEYSYHLESAFSDFMREPSGERFNRVSELERYRAHLDDHLPVTGLGRGTLASFVLLGVSVTALFAAYFVLTARGIWLDGPGLRAWLLP